jgi:hypothetical protein
LYSARKLVLKSALIELCYQLGVKATANPQIATWKNVSGF